MSLVNAVKSLCAHYLFNQWLKFDQTSTDTSSGWGKEVIRFWWPWSYFQGHYIINTQKVSLVNAVKKLCAHYLFNQLLVLVDFHDLDFIFKVTGHASTLKLKFCWGGGGGGGGERGGGRVLNKRCLLTIFILFGLRKQREVTNDAQHVKSELMSYSNRKCTSVQSDLGLLCLSTFTMLSIDFVSGKQSGPVLSANRRRAFSCIACQI